MARNHTSVSYVATISFSIAIIILSPIALAGNALVLAAIWRNPSLRNPPYILLCGLAFTDVCTGLITQPSYVAAEMMCLRELQESQDRLSFLRFAKVVSAGCGTYFSSMTVLLITLMSIERWLFMSRRSLVTKLNAYLILTIVLMLPVPFTALRTLQVLHGTHEFALNTLTFSVLLLCLLSTIVAYFKVIRIINRHQRQIKASSTSQNYVQQAINSAKYKKSVLTILLIVVLFYISYLPFLVFVGLDVSHESHSKIALAYSFSMIFMFLSSALNPLLYFWRMKDIRNEIRHLLKQFLSR